MARNFRRVFVPAAFVFAALIGAVLGIHHPRDAAAGSENVRWMGATFVGHDPNAEFCFGRGDWHEGGIAADVFADDVALCGGPSVADVYTLRHVAERRFIRTTTFWASHTMEVA